MRSKKTRFKTKRADLAAGQAGLGARGPALLPPRSLREFDRRFKTDQACRYYLIGLRWPKGFVCRRCAGTGAWLTGRGLLHCYQCRADTSVTAGTIFHGLHLPLRTWFRAMWLLSTEGVAPEPRALQRLLGIRSYKTAWTCLGKLRRAMETADRLLEGTVEVQAVALRLPGRAASTRRRQERTCLVAVAVETRPGGLGRLKLRVLADASPEALGRFAREVSASGTTISFGTHWKLPGPGVRRVAARLQRWLLTRVSNRLTRAQLPGFLDEFVFREGHLQSPRSGELFHLLARHAVSLDPAPYRTRLRRQP